MALESLSLYVLHLNDNSGYKCENACRQTTQDNKALLLLENVICFSMNDWYMVRMMYYVYSTSIYR